LQLREHGTKPAINKAVRRLREFHDYLRSIRVLDPACGSGNFLYVSLNLLKEIELEVVREIEEVTGQPEAAIEQVSPAQFH
ncbi:MAG: DNA methyltransferase, partial [Wenzhouxiangellaceae bacterium]